MKATSASVWGVLSLLIKTKIQTKTEDGCCKKAEETGRPSCVLAQGMLDEPETVPVYPLADCLFLLARGADPPQVLTGWLKLVMYTRRISLNGGCTVMLLYTRQVRLLTRFPSCLLGRQRGQG